MLTPHGYAAYAVGKWHLTPGGRDPPRRPAATAGPWARASSAGTGSSPARPTSSCPTSSTTATTSSRPARYEDGYHLTADLVDQRHRDGRGPAQRRRRQAVVPLPGHRGLPLAAPDAAGLDRALPRPLRRRAGTSGARPPSARQKAAGPAARAHRAVAPPGLGAGVGRPVRARSSASTPATWRPSPPSSPTPTTSSGRLVDRLEAMGELDDTVIVVLSDNGASSEGGPTGSVNDVRVWNALPRTVEEADERLDEIGGPRIHNNYPWGWTVAGNTPFRRWKRETHEGGVADPLIVHWPARHRGPGRAAPPVRARHRPAAHAARRDRHRGAEPRSAGVAQRPLDGVSVAETFADADAPERHTVQYYEMFGCRALYEDGWKAVTYHDIQSDEPGPRPGAVGALRPAGRPVGVPRPRRRGARPARRDGGALVGRGRAQPGAAARQPAVLRAGLRAAAVGGAPGPLHATGPAGRRCPRAWPSTCGAGPTSITAHVTIPADLDVRRGRARRAGLGAGRLVVPPAGRRAPLLRAQPGRLAPRTGSRPTSAALAPGRPRRWPSASRGRPPSSPVDGVVVGDRRGAAHGLEPVLDHRRRPHRRLVARLLAGRRGLPRPLRVHRHPPPRRHRRRGPARSSTPTERGPRLDRDAQ